MPTQRYNVQQPPISSILSWIEDGDIAIPEIQRPFVWNATKVRNFLDSLFQGFPVGFLIAWKNPDIKLKDGTTSSGKRILIDGSSVSPRWMASCWGERSSTKLPDTTNPNRVSSSRDALRGDEPGDSQGRLVDPLSPTCSVRRRVFGIWSRTTATRTRSAPTTKYSRASSG